MAGYIDKHYVPDIPVMAHRLEDRIVELDWAWNEQRRMVCLTRHLAISFLRCCLMIFTLPSYDNGIRRRNVLYVVFSSGRQSFGREGSVELEHRSILQVSRDETKTGDGGA